MNFWTVAPSAVIQVMKEEDKQQQEQQHQEQQQQEEEDQQEHLQHGEYEEQEEEQQLEEEGPGSRSSELCSFRRLWKVLNSSLLCSRHSTAALLQHVEVLLCPAGGPAGFSDLMAPRTLPGAH